MEEGICHNTNIMLEQRIFNIEAYNAAQEHALQNQFRQMEERFGILCDVDETLVDTIGNHSDRINRGARIMGFSEELPTREELIEKGGTGAFAELFGMTSDEWEIMMQRIRDSKYINAGATLYHPEIVSLVEQFSNTKMLGFVTARPGTEKTLRVTEEDLFRRIGLPQLPIVLRPSTVAIAETSAWKLGILKQIAVQDTQKRLILVDDSLATANVILEYNSCNESNPIIQVVYKGPLTIPSLESGAFKTDPKMGIYEADWHEMPQVIQQIQQQW